MHRMAVPGAASPRREREKWGRPPGLRGTPSSCRFLANEEQADRGGGRGPGGPPHTATNGTPKGARPTI
jgi:hypothetical protein